MHQDSLSERFCGEGVPFKSAPHLGPRTPGVVVEMFSTAIFGGGHDIHQKLEAREGTPKKMIQNDFTGHNSEIRLLIKGRDW